MFIVFLSFLFFCVCRFISILFFSFLFFIIFILENRQIIAWLCEQRSRSRLSTLTASTFVADKTDVGQAVRLTVASAENLVRVWWNNVTVLYSGLFIHKSSLTVIFKGGNSVVGGDTPSFTVVTKGGLSVMVDVTCSMGLFSSSPCITSVVTLCRKGLWRIRFDLGQAMILRPGSVSWTSLLFRTSVAWLLYQWSLLVE